MPGAVVAKPFLSFVTGLGSQMNDREWFTEVLAGHETRDSHDPRSVCGLPTSLWHW
jgi:hypothetical protein